MDVYDLCQRHAKAFCIENPVGVMSKWKPPSQTIQPYWFGDPVRKTTHLWIHRLPHLLPTNTVSPELVTYVGKKVTTHSVLLNTGPIKLRSQTRSVTFPGVAAAMAARWGAYDVITNLRRIP
jgi:hypothetical protein